jgi:hypothetical protein
VLYEDLTVIGVDITVFLVVTPCSLVRGVSWCLRVQDKGGCTFLDLLLTIYETTCCHFPEDYNVNESSVLQCSTMPH